MWKGTRVLLVLVALAARVHDSLQQKPRLGGAVNVFSRYGYLSISMRVVPRNDSDTWIFREPTLDVFIDPQPAPNKLSKATVVFDGDFHMEFCDNVRQLLQVKRPRPHCNQMDGAFYFLSARGFFEKTKADGREFFYWKIYGRDLGKWSKCERG